MPYFSLFLGLFLSLDFETFFCSYLFSFSYLLLLSFLFLLFLYQRSILTTFANLIQIFSFCTFPFLFKRYNLFPTTMVWGRHILFWHFLSNVCSAIELLSLQRLNLKDDEEPWSSLIRWLDWKYAVLDEHRFYRVKLWYTSVSSIKTEFNRYFIKSRDIKIPNLPDHDILYHSSEVSRLWATDNDNKQFLLQESRRLLLVFQRGISCKKKRFSAYGKPHTDW